MELELDAALSASLQELAKNEAVTLSALVQALWAIVLGNANNGCRDVVFGVVASGRPAELAGIESAVGLFIQTSPLRARWASGDSLGALLAHVKEQNLQQMRYGYVPLATLGRNLLDHLMVFENYPVATCFDHNRVQLRDMRGFEKLPYALGISVIPGVNLRFRFLYDPERLPEERALACAARCMPCLRQRPLRPGAPALRWKKRRIPRWQAQKSPQKNWGAQLMAVGSRAGQKMRPIPLPPQPGKPRPRKGWMLWIWRKPCARPMPPCLGALWILWMRIFSSLAATA